MVGLAISVIVIFSALGGALVERMKVEPVEPSSQKLVLNEENVVIDVAEKVSSSVVTVAIKKEQAVRSPLFLNTRGEIEGLAGQTETIQRDIGSGFIVSADGLIVTNKHVVGDQTARYRVITRDNTEYDVVNIYRDPANDLAILKIEPKKETVLVPVEMGDSDGLAVGQGVIAIGTALGEFRHTVTTGVISGLGRGITAGDGGVVGRESLDDVIQTDAAINLGNSGGPLLNRVGGVIGVNVAVAQGASNIGFALPINVVVDSLSNFAKTGRFNRPQFGVRYRMLDQQTALLGDVPKGALVVEVVTGSAAAKAGVKNGDIVVAIDGEKVGNVRGGLAGLIGSKKIGASLEVEVFRDGKTVKATAILEETK